MDEDRIWWAAHWSKTGTRTGSYPYHHASLMEIVGFLASYMKQFGHKLDRRGHIVFRPCEDQVDVGKDSLTRHPMGPKFYSWDKNP